MTKIIQIDCNKAWRIIGYTSWALITIGLGFSTWFGYDYSINPHVIAQDMCNTDKKLDPNFNWYACKTYTDNSLYYFTFILHLINIGAIWYKIHTKIRLVEIRCK